MKPIKVRAWDKSEELVLPGVLKMLADNDMWDDEMSMWEVADAMETGNDERLIFDLWTGAKDDDGNEIYMNDFVGIISGWYSGAKKIGEVSETLLIDEINKNRLDGMPISIKVIGNIYENKELIEKANTCIFPEPDESGDWI